MKSRLFSPPQTQRMAQRIAGKRGKIGQNGGKHGKHGNP
jgi:hypothetical protein